MIMKFCCATFLALAYVSGTTDAFLAPFATKSTMATLHMAGDADGDQGEEDSPGGSKFKDILEQANKQQSQPMEPAARVIENPFLTQQQPSTPLDPEELSVEEQARRFREMTQNDGATRNEPPPVRRVAKTDRAGKPVGRNRDADSIANTADLYFAQLKRDSSVRNMARQRGDNEIAEQVMADEGVKELESLLVANPYLEGQRQKEKSLFDSVPEEVLKPYFDSDNIPDEEKNSAGISYKEILQQKRQKRSGQISPTNAPVQQAPLAVEQPVKQPPVVQSSPEPLVHATPPAAVPQAPVQVTQSAASPPPVRTPVSNSPVSGNPEETRGKIRTLMGLLLKHRGGPGFGKGRLNGGGIDQFDKLLREVTSLLQEEAAQSFVVSQPESVIRQPAVAVQTHVAPAAAQPVFVAVDPSQMDSIVACIEGAIAMYKNSPPELKGSVLVTLRAALASAVNTSNSILGANSVGAGVLAGTSPIEGTIAVIEGAVIMYKNSPPELKDSVLVTLRAALESAVRTCDILLGNEATSFAAATLPVVTAPTATPAPQAVAQPATSVVSQAAPPVAPIQSAPALALERVIRGADPNSRALEKIYADMKDAAGEGSLGLRSDLTSTEASELADRLVEMRVILMQELDGGIPDPEPDTTLKSQGGDSTVSKYQAMLAKAKAEKAGNV